MNKKKIEPFKINIQLELAYEVISYSILIILIGVAFVFGSNLLSFNWYSFFFTLFAICFIYIKRNSYLTIADDQLTVSYLKFIHKIELDMADIDEFIFYEQGRQVKIRKNSNEIVMIHLKEKNKKALLDWLVQYYPTIPCLFFNRNNE